MQIQHSDSSYQARAILGAWQAGDQARLREELDRVKSVKCDCFDSGEAERLELLSEIAQELGASDQPFTGDSSQVCCDLLEHLVYSGIQARRRRPATPAWQRGTLAMVTVLQ